MRRARVGRLIKARSRLRPRASDRDSGEILCNIYKRGERLRADSGHGFFEGRAVFGLPIFKLGCAAHGVLEFIFRRAILVFLRVFI